MKKGWPNKFKALKSWLSQKMLRNAGFEVLPFWTMFKFLGSLLAPVPNLSSLGVYYKARRIAGSAASTCSQSCARAADANATPMSVGIRWIHAANAATGYVYVDVACHAASAVPRVDLACDAPSPTTASPRPSCLHGGVCCGWTHSAGTPRIDTRTSRGGAEGSCTGFAIWGLKRARCVGVIHWLSVSIRVTLLQHSSVAIATCTWFEVLNWPRVQWTDGTEQVWCDIFRHVPWLHVFESTTYSRHFTTGTRLSASQILVSTVRRRSTPQSIAFDIIMWYLFHKGAARNAT